MKRLKKLKLLFLMFLRTPVFYNRFFLPLTDRWQILGSPFKVLRCDVLSCVNSLKKINLIPRFTTQTLDDCNKKLGLPNKRSVFIRKVWCS